MRRVAGVVALLASTSCGDIDPPSSNVPAEVLQGPYICGAPPQPVNPRTVPVFINEVFAGSVEDESEDWFEIHNAGTDVVALDGWIVEDLLSGALPKTVPGEFEFPPGTMLCPGGFYVVERDNGCEADNFDFGIGSADRLVLRHVSGDIVDDAEWQDLPQGQSVGRPHDEPGDFQFLVPLQGISKWESNDREGSTCWGECEGVGRCTPRDGVCVAESEEKCLASEACRRLGWCGLVDGECQPTAPGHCQQSGVCSEKGRCGLVDGTCQVASDADCQTSELCTDEGRCSAVLESPSRCIATLPADCRVSNDCTKIDDTTALVEKGRCTLDGERCVATSCENTAACAEKGCCMLVDGKCTSL